MIENFKVTGRIIVFEDKVLIVTNSANKYCDILIDIYNLI